MDSLNATAFFSRPFEGKYKASVALINAICAGIDVKTVCVDEGSHDTPSKEANNLIKSSDFLVAFCTRRYEIEGGEWLTSTAVREEIASADAMQKKLVFFFEKGVKRDGFADNRATSFTLDDAEELTPEDIRRITAYIHKAKLAAVSNSDDVFHATGVKNFNISRLEARFELVESQGGLLWEYTTEKSLQFEAEHDLPITSGAYCMKELEGCERSPNYVSEVKRNGKDDHPTIEEVRERGFIELKTQFDPLPKPGDQIFIREKFQSPFLGPVYSNNALSPVKIGRRSFNAYDGLAVVHRISSFRLRFVFPETVGVDGFCPVVATFSKSLDYINDDEIARIRSSDSFSVETFDGKQIVTLRVDRPLYQYFYGVAWKLPKARKDGPTLAAESDQWVYC